MESEELLEALRSLMGGGLVTIEPSNNEAAALTKSHCYSFKNIPKEIIQQRRLIEMAVGVWYFVTDRFYGSEYTDDLLGLGIFIVVVNDLEKARTEPLDLYP